MHDIRPLLVSGVALAGGALALLLALWAQQEYHRWQYHPRPRKRRKPPEWSATRATP